MCTTVAINNPILGKATTNLAHLLLFNQISKIVKQNRKQATTKSPMHRWEKKKSDHDRTRTVNLEIVRPQNFRSRHLVVDKQSINITISYCYAITAVATYAGIST